jgi:hypothetical protein
MENFGLSFFLFFSFLLQELDGTDYHYNTIWVFLLVLSSLWAHDTCSGFIQQNVNYAVFVVAHVRLILRFDISL